MPAIDKATGTALFLLTAAEIPNFYSGFLPSLFTITTFGGGPAEKVAHTRRWIRKGELQATVLSVLTGAAASAIAHEPWPLLAALAMSVYLISQYERALRAGCADGAPKFDMDNPEGHAKAPYARSEPGFTVRL